MGMGSLSPGKASGGAAWRICSVRPRDWQSGWTPAWRALGDWSMPSYSGCAIWGPNGPPWGSGGAGGRRQGAFGEPGPSRVTAAVPYGDGTAHRGAVAGVVCALQYTAHPTR